MEYARVIEGQALQDASPEQLVIEAPVVAVVEAKNENMKSGIALMLHAIEALLAWNEDQLPRPVTVLLVSPCAIPVSR